MKALWASLVSFALVSHAAPLTPLPTITSSGMAALTFVETGSRSWINNYGGGSPGGQFNVWDGKNNPTSSTLSGTTINQVYAWGKANVTFTVQPDKTLRVSGTISNETNDTLTISNLILCKIAFPTTTKSDIVKQTLFEPGFASMNASSPDIACYFAYSDWNGWPGNITIGQDNWGNNALYAKSLSIAAGASKNFDFHLNFVTTADELKPIQTAANQAFAQFYPQLRFATDLRSIGQIFFVTGEGSSGWAANNAKWAKNPRGWLGDPNLDISDKATFKSRMEAFCRQCVTNADSIPGMRGFVIWDCEGQQYPHGASVYAGHPTFMPQMAPEMDEIIDDLVKILEAGGKYQIGFCLRQEQFFANPGNPQMAFYAKSWPNSDSPEAIADLENEINWTRARFGPDKCKIYYVDSNNGKEINCYTKFTQEYPDCLIFPECFYVVTRMYSVATVYQQARPQDYVRNGPATQPQFTAVYPGAQSLINLADYPRTAAEVDATVDTVVASMLAKNIQMVRIWWTGGPEYSLLQKATPKAQAQGWPFANPTPTPSPSPSPSPSVTPIPPTPTPSPTVTPTPTPGQSYSQWWDEVARWIFDHPPVPNK